MTGALTIGPEGGPAVTTLAADGAASFAGNVISQNPIANAPDAQLLNNGIVFGTRMSTNWSTNICRVFNRFQ